MYRKCIFLILVIGIGQLSYSQNFFKDYRNKLLKYPETNQTQITSLDLSIKRLKLMTGQFKKKNRYSFFSTDTVYLINFKAAETGFTSAIIWNRKASCYYHYSYETKSQKMVNPKLDVKLNAKDILSSFNQIFKRSIETGDTLAYHIYADKHKVFDGEWVEPIMAVKKGSHWVLTNFPENGWAINYDF